MHLSVTPMGDASHKDHEMNVMTLIIFGIPTEKKNPISKQGLYVIPQHMDLNNNNDNRKYVKGTLHVFLKEMYSTPKRYFDMQRVYGQNKAVLAHAMEAYRVSTGFPLLILNLSPRRR